MKIRSGRTAARITSALLLLAFAVFWSQPARTVEDTVSYIVTYGSDVNLLSLPQTEPEDLAALCGYDPGEYIISVSEHDSYTVVNIIDALDVTVLSDGETRSVMASGGTVGDLLDGLNISLGDDDILSHDPGAPLEDGMTIKIGRVTFREISEEKTVPHGTVYQDSSTLYKGTEETVTNGSDGLERLTYRVKYIDGAEAERELVGRETVTEAVDTVIARGTKVKETPKPAPPPDPGPTSTPSGSGGLTSSGGESQTPDQSGSGGGSQNPDQSGSGGGSQTPDQTGSNGGGNGSTSGEDGSTGEGGTLTTPSGEQLSYSKCITMKATAYTYPPGAITSSGAPVQVGIVAALPSTLPPGTRVYIVTLDGQYTYGPAVVGDTPGSDIIDLFFDTLDECYEFGVRNAYVYILD